MAKNWIEERTYTPKSEILVGIPTYNDPTAREAIGHVSKPRKDLRPSITGMKIGETNQLLHALNKARDEGFVSKREYSEKKRVLRSGLPEYWKKLQKGGI